MGARVKKLKQAAIQAQQTSKFASEYAAIALRAAITMNDELINNEAEFCQKHSANMSHVTRKLLFSLIDKN